MVDVSTETVIDRPCEVVAEYAGDPSNAPEWHASIASVRPLTSPPVAVGSRIVFVASFLRRTLEYTYEVAELEPSRRMVMRTAEGPFPMETTYTWAPVGQGRTRMIVRNRGEPAGFSRLIAPFVAGAMRRASRKDLAALKALLEGR